MRGNQEVFILVKIKDGRQYVCALNRLKTVREQQPTEGEKQLANAMRSVVWH